MRKRSLALLPLLTLLACGPEKAAEEPVQEAAQAGPILPKDQAGQIVQRAIDYHGGWDAWAAKETVEFDKTTIRYRPDGTEESRRKQHHRYVLRPELKARIEWEKEGRKIALTNSGGDAWRTVDGQPATSEEDRNGARNSTFGSHYVFNMPWKLADPGVHLAYAGRETLADGIVVDKVRVTYDQGTGDAGGLHTWTYYFDTKTGRLTSNLLEYGPGEYDYTEYIDDRQVEDLRLPARRFGYGADEKGKRGPKVSEIVYENVRFGVPLDEALFQRP
jgi:hypothetical protein